MSLTPAEIDTLTNLLRKLDAGKDLPHSVFLEFARLQCFPIVELVPLRVAPAADKIEVLLLEREKADPVWGGQLHTPGTVVRSADGPKGISGILRRLVDRELPGAQFAGEFTYVATITHQVKRGAECATVLYINIANYTGAGEWHEVLSLPDRIVATQKEFIRLAAKQFNKDLGIGLAL